MPSTSASSAAHALCASVRVQCMHISTIIVIFIVDVAIAVPSNSIPNHPGCDGAITLVFLSHSRSRTLHIKSTETIQFPILAHSTDGRTEKKTSSHACTLVSLWFLLYDRFGVFATLEWHDSNASVHSVRLPIHMIDAGIFAGYIWFWAPQRMHWVQVKGQDTEYARHSQPISSAHRSPYPNFGITW